MLNRSPPRTPRGFRTGDCKITLEVFLAMVLTLVALGFAEVIIVNPTKPPTPKTAATLNTLVNDH